MNLLDSFDSVFNPASTNKERQVIVRQQKGDTRLDFFSHLLKRLVDLEPSELRPAPSVYGNHVEYLCTLLPMIIEDTIASIPSQVDGGVRLYCRYVNRWLPPFQLAICECDRETVFYGNELIYVSDKHNNKIWGITKKGVRRETAGNSTIELLLYTNEQVDLDTNFICYVLLDLNSHLREYVATQKVPRSCLLTELMAKKAKRKVKKVEDSKFQLPTDSDLNPSQLNAVSTAINRENGMVLIQGPPGTGKTKTIVNILESLVSIPSIKKAGILVCAPSNTAIDELTLRLSSTMGKRARIVRISAFGRGDNCREVLLQTFAQPSEELTKLLRNTDRQLIKTGAEDDAATGWHSYEIDSLLDRKDALNAVCRNTEWSTKKDVIREADIILCTLSMAASPIIVSSMASFSTVIIDEAAQAVEPSTLIPMSYDAKRLILVGDPCQLPATVKSSQALENGYGKSLFERLEEAGMPICLLNTQYRMHPAIRAFPAKYFYDDRLKDGVTVTSQDYYNDWYFSPYLLFNLDWSTESTRGTSICNDAEAQFVSVLLKTLCNRYPDIRQRMAVLTAYRAQLDLLKRDIGISKDKIDMGTVDGFQGKEADIVLLSCVRTSTGEFNTTTIGFLNDRRRMNVALTRARNALWVIGNTNTLRINADWEELVKDAERRGLLVDVSIHENGFKLLNRITEEEAFIH